VVNKDNSPVNIRFVVKTSDIRNFSENITSDVNTSEMATLRQNEIDKQWPPAYKQHITWLDSYKKKQRRGGSWSSREINFTYYFYCIKAREVLTLRQPFYF